MFQTSNPSRPRQLTNDDRLRNEQQQQRSVYFHPYNNGRRTNSDFGGPSSSQMITSSHHHGGSRWETRAECDEDEDEPMDVDILYERDVSTHNYHHTNDRLSRRRHNSEPITTSHASSTMQAVKVGDTPADNLDLRLSTAADNLLAILQREAKDYSMPLPARYYPTEFADDDDFTGTTGGIVENGGGTGSEPPRGSSTPSTGTIGPWRKRIASWMYDVVDHFRYDRNAVAIALHYIDRYVGHVLVENDRLRRRRCGVISDDVGIDQPPIKRRHFQLIAVTCLYLAIKVHGELTEADPSSGEAYDVVASLVNEVDGRAFLGMPIAEKEDKIEEDEDKMVTTNGGGDEHDDDIKAMSRKIADLARRHRMARWGSKLSQFGLPTAIHPSPTPTSFKSLQPSFPKPSVQPKQPHSSLPFKPRKRGMLSGPLRLHSFVELSRGLFTAMDIVETEKLILLSMDYAMNPPTSRRVVGELLRMLALCFAGVDGLSTGDSTLDLDRKEILGNILNKACRQIEAAASVPALSIGCLPSVVAYGAMLNAIDEEFEDIVSSSMIKDQGKDNSTPQLEDYQRHYQRYSRNTSPSPSTAKDQFLEAWKTEFLVAVYHATESVLSPDLQDIFHVRDLLLDSIGSTSTSSSDLSSSPTEGGIKIDANNKFKRSPRSPRSTVVLPNNPRMFQSSGGSFFGLSSSNLGGSNVMRLLSSPPYDEGRSGLTRSQTVGSASAIPFHHSNSRVYYKQQSEPILELPPTMPTIGNHGRIDYSVGRRFINEGTHNNDNNNCDAIDSWRISSARGSGEEVSPPPASVTMTNPNPPHFFSA